MTIKILRKNLMAIGSRRHITALIGVGLGILFLWLAVRNVEWRSVMIAFRSANLLVAVPILGLLAGYYGLKAMRWSILVRPIKRLSAVSLIPALMIGLAANNLFPAHLGEFVRMYVLSQKEKVPSSAVLATLVVERILDMVSILLIVSVAAMGQELSDGSRIAGAILIASLVGFVSLIVFLIKAQDRMEQLVSRFLVFLPRKMVDKIVSQLRLATRGFDSLRNLREYPVLLLNSLLQWLLMAAAIYLSIYAFDISVPWASAVLVLGLIVAGITLPSAPGFFGTVELCFVVGLAAFAVDESLALSAAIFYHIITWGTATIVGLALLRFADLSLADFERKRGATGTE